MEKHIGAKTPSLFFFSILEIYIIEVDWRWSYKLADNSSQSITPDHKPIGTCKRELSMYWDFKYNNIYSSFFVLLNNNREV